jgi:hypothetical protein
MVVPHSRRPPDRLNSVGLRLAEPGALWHRSVVSRDPISPQIVAAVNPTSLNLTSSTEADTFSTSQPRSRVSAPSTS